MNVYYSFSRKVDLIGSSFGGLLLSKYTALPELCKYFG